MHYITMKKIGGIILAVRPFGSDLFFLVISCIASGLYFLASLFAFISMDVREFGHLTHGLTLATLAASILQCGSSISLPSCAHRSPRLLGQLISSLTIGSAIFGLSAVAASIIFEFLSDHRSLIPEATVYSSCLGFSTVLDSYCKAVSHKLVSALGALVSNLTFLMTMVIASHFIEINASFYLVTAGLFRIAFSCVCIISTKIPILLADFSWRCLFLSFPKTNHIIVILSLANTDVFALNSITKGDSWAAYLSARHFAYGVYLAVIQEGLLPIFMARYLTKEKRIKASEIAWISFLSSGIVAITSIPLAEIILTIKQTPVEGFMVISMLPTLWISAHASTVVAINLKNVFSRTAHFEAIFILPFILCCSYAVNYINTEVPLSTEENIIIVSFFSLMVQILTLGIYFYRYHEENRSHLERG